MAWPVAVPCVEPVPPPGAVIFAVAVPSARRLVAVAEEVALALPSTPPEPPFALAVALTAWAPVRLIDEDAAPPLPPPAKPPPPQPRLALLVPVRELAWGACESVKVRVDVAAPPFPPAPPELDPPAPLLAA